MRILVTGDTHGEILWWDKHVLKLAARRGAAVVVQVGDFGIWPRGDRYLDRLHTILDERGLRVVFIDGNHEDYDQLLALPVDSQGWHPVRPSITHAPRGLRWTWAGLRFLALGGAASHDREFRVPGVSWWPEEAITEEDVARCLEGGPVDVMICHEAPAALDYGRPPDANRAAVQRVVEALRPRILFHGHWHRSVRSWLGPTLVVGLACDGMSGACVAVDLEALRAAADVNATVVAVDSGRTRP